jgi:hypothetical protein
MARRNQPSQAMQSKIQGQDKELPKRISQPNSVMNRHEFRKQKAWRGQGVKKFVSLGWTKDMERTGIPKI